MTEQLLLFEETHQTQSAHYMRLWDKKGHPIKRLDRNWYPYPTGSKSARTKSVAKVRHRFDQLTSTGLIGFGEIVTTESKIAEHQYGDESITLQNYPPSTTKKKDLK